MKVLNEDTGATLLFDIEIQASKDEIEKAVVMLRELLTRDNLPNEAIFIQTIPEIQIVRVTKK